jgi:hypothetical protein
MANEIDFSMVETPIRARIRCQHVLFPKLSIIIGQRTLSCKEKLEEEVGAKLVKNGPDKDLFCYN